MSNPNPLPADPASRWLRRAGWIALALYAAFLSAHFSSVAGGADSSGYLNSARLLATGTLAGELRTPAEFGPQKQLRRQQFQPHGFVPFDGNPRLSPTYPVGLPLHLAAAGLMLGWDIAPVAVGVGSAAAALVALYAVARELRLSAMSSLAAAAVLAGYPVFLFTSIQPLSDTLATTWCLIAVWAALRARSQPGWALACGAAVGMAVLVRVTDGMLIPTLVVLLGRDWRRLAAAGAGGLPFAVWLGYYNHTLYGSAFTSGYVDIAKAFGWEYGALTAWHFLKWLALLLPAVVLVLPFASRPQGARAAELCALALWFGTFTGLYAFYQISHEVWWCLRFILPGTPALILAAMIGLERLTTARPAIHAVAAGGLALWALGLGWHWTAKFHLLLTPQYERVYADAAAAARANFPPDTAVVAGLHSGALYYYTPFPVLRWEFLNPGDFSRYLKQSQRAGRPYGAVLFDLEEAEALQKNCPGEWQKVAKVKNTSLWLLHPPSRGD